MRKNVYEAADKAIQQMNRVNIKRFDRLRLMPRDELHIIREVLDAYRQSEKYARQRYYEVALEAYLLAMLEAGESNERATREADRAIDMDWVDMWLEETDPITKYIFGNEAERKAHRLAEALSIALNRNDEIDKALKLWTRQVGQFAITATDRARLEGFRRAGVRRVMWVTQNDERVCAECDGREGKVYDIDKVPVKHINCRCFLVRARD